ncbi:MAG TPA: helix-turn-helix domain-containing protein [Fodinibius sp.]|nr:helix-turn-helix domain-containing protein [Fodinibius sp.]
MDTIMIKNMVCDRCISTVRKILEDLNYCVEDVCLGKAIIQEDLSEKDLSKIEEQLEESGFELIREPEAALVEEIKTQLIAYLQRLEESRGELAKMSEYLSEHLHHNYSDLSSRFSDYEETTVEQYFIHLKIERVKELLSYGEMTLSEIAYELNYSSVSYLSNQFKKVVGMSVTDYKKARNSFRKPLDGVGK